MRKDLLNSRCFSLKTAIILLCVNRLVMKQCGWLQNGPTIQMRVHALYFSRYHRFPPSINGAHYGSIAYRHSLAYVNISVLQFQSETVEARCAKSGRHAIRYTSLREHLEQLIQRNSCKKSQRPLRCQKICLDFDSKGN